MLWVRRMYFIEWGGTYLSWNDESDRFNSRCCNLVCPSNLTFGHLQGAAGEEAHSTLGV